MPVCAVLIVVHDIFIRQSLHGIFAPLLRPHRAGIVTPK